MAWKDPASLPWRSDSQPTGDAVAVGSMTMAVITDGRNVMVKRLHVCAVSVGSRVRQRPGFGVRPVDVPGNLTLASGRVIV